MAPLHERRACGAGGGGGDKVCTVNKRRTARRWKEREERPTQTKTIFNMKTFLCAAFKAARTKISKVLI